MPDSRKDIGPLEQAQTAFLGFLTSQGIRPTLTPTLPHPNAHTCSTVAGSLRLYTRCNLAHIHPHCCNLRRPPHAGLPPPTAPTPGPDAAACCDPGPERHRTPTAPPTPTTTPPPRPRPSLLYPTHHQDRRRDLRGPRKEVERPAVAEDPPRRQAARPAPSGERTRWPWKRARPGGSEAPGTGPHDARVTVAVAAAHTVPPPPTPTPPPRRGAGGSGPGGGGSLAGSPSGGGGFFGRIVMAAPPVAPANPPRGTLGEDGWGGGYSGARRTTGSPGPDKELAARFSNRRRNAGHAAWENPDVKSKIKGTAASLS